MTNRTALLFANEMFYRAFADRDMPAMQDIWADDTEVSCVHPGWNPLFGRENVMASLRGIFNGPQPPAVECHAPAANIIGDTGIVICFEVIGEDYLVATNIFKRKGHTWVLCHHQAGPAEELPAVEDEEDEEPGAMN